MKFKFNPDPVIKSTRRLQQDANLIKNGGHQDPILFYSIRKETKLLLWRALKLWFDVRWPFWKT